MTGKPLGAQRRTRCSGHLIGAPPKTSGHALRIPKELTGHDPNATPCGPRCHAPRRDPSDRRAARYSAGHQQAWFLLGATSTPCGPIHARPHPAHEPRSSWPTNKCTPRAFSVVANRDGALGTLAEIDGAEMAGARDDQVSAGCRPRYRERPRPGRIVTGDRQRGGRSLLLTVSVADLAPKLAGWKRTGGSSESPGPTTSG